jgi:transposase
MWTTKNRPRYNRDTLRYPSDLTDAEWSQIAPLIPPGKRGGGKRRVDLREVMNGIMYILSTGCQWRAIPKDLPARSTLYDYFDLWSWNGTLERIHHALYVECREQRWADMECDSSREIATAGVTTLSRDENVGSHVAAIRLLTLTTRGLFKPDDITCPAASE